MTMKKKNKKIAMTAAGIIIIAALIYAFIVTQGPQYGISLPMTTFEAYGYPQQACDGGVVSGSGEMISPGEIQGQYSAIQAQCTDPNYPKYCSSVNLCYASWVDCNTIEYCGDNYYGCKSGNKIVCYHGDAWCFDDCIKEDTVAECGGGMWGCWIEGCDGKTGSVPYCINGQYHCCPQDYPVYKQDLNSCWKEDWQCTADNHCNSGYVCKNHKCEQQICPTCPLPSTWSECVDSKHQRIVYVCGPETGYVCQTRVEQESCVMPGPQPICGDSVCDIEAGETVITCPLDCQSTPEPQPGPFQFDLTTWVIIILIVIIVLLVIYFGFIKK